MELLLNQQKISGSKSYQLQSHAKLVPFNNTASRKLINYLGMKVGT